MNRSMLKTSRWSLLGTVLTLCSLPGHAALGPGGNTATESDYTAAPPLVVEGADPFLMINLSVELTQQAESYTDGEQTYAAGTFCPGRRSENGSWLAGGSQEVGICYSSAETYIGYFDPNKCYEYVTGANTNPTQAATGPRSDSVPDYFRPVAATASNHTCTGSYFSGNYMNWATMSALDQFRAAMTGGARLIDTAGSNARTLLIRTKRFDSWNFVVKAISSSGLSSGSGGNQRTFTNAPSGVTPFSAATSVYAVNDFGDISGATGGPSGHRVRFYNQDGTLQGTYNVIVQTCVTGQLETNCVRYTDGTNTWYKPEGLLQKNALKMRYALTSYTGRTGNTINGGVLRANAKYIGALRPVTGGGFEANPNAEIDAQGLVVFDPDALAGKVGVNSIAPVNSGIINYINQFGIFAGNYKANDPDAELYYEGLRYLMNLGPTTSFWSPSTALTAAEQDGYPIFAANNAGSPAWSDPITNVCQKNYALYVGDKNSHRNDYLPGGLSRGADDPTCSTECADAVAKGINVGTFEGLINNVEGGWPANYNGWGNTHGNGLAALAWWARNNDFRTDKAGDQRLKTFIIDTQEHGSAQPVGPNNTLWIAAKWGGYEDTNNNNFYNGMTSPDLLTEWNARGAVFSDGTRLPDAYTLASQPANLVAGLTQAFNEALERSSSASAAAVVANSSSGAGALYQALYEPRLSNSSTAVVWTGLVRGFFTDSQGRIREDSNADGQLTSADNVVRFRQDPAQKITVADRYNSSNALLQSNLAVRELLPIWDAAKRLTAMTDTQVATQRTFADSADTGRYIFTWLDNNSNGVVDTGETVDFMPASFPNIDATTNDSIIDPARYLNLDSTTGANAGNLVNYVRGVDQTGWRNRKIDRDADGTPDALRLGDVVHSAPLVVGAPNENYDLVYADDSYTAFKNHYADRRQVIYAGANDGMLHAFNGGFFTATLDGSGNIVYGFSTTKTGMTSHPLGSELWAYVPFNLLPHLQWLKDPAYTHTYYVDGTPQAFDVNIFTADTDHPHGWGTILVVGFRLGGGEITVNAARDQSGASDADNKTMYPAYLVFDITNPEVAPKLIAEISNPALGHTIGQPTVVKKRADTAGSYISPSANQWYLVFGSGPIGSNAVTKQLAHDNAVSNQQAKMFVYDLNNRSLIDSSAIVAGTNPFPIGGENNAFVADLTAKDWDLDYTDELVYFGTVANTVANPEGSLMRMSMPTSYSFGSPSFSRLLNTAQPFSTRPLALRDINGQAWVYAGTGRFYSSADISSAKQMNYYGVKEPLNSGGAFNLNTVAKTDLVNSTGIRVFVDGTVASSSNTTPITINSTSVGDFSELVQVVSAAGGWYINLSSTAARDVDITELFFDTLLVTEYTASNNTCDPLGFSRRLAPSMLTGTASPYAPIGSTNTITLGGQGMALFSADLGFGQFYSSGIVRLGDGSFVDWRQDSTGGSSGSTLTGPGSKNSRMSWREIPIQ